MRRDPERAWADSATPGPAIPDEVGTSDVACAGWSQTYAADLLGTDQSRVSDLRRGRLDRISLEQLVRFLGRIGGSIELQITWSSRHSYLHAQPKKQQ